VDVIPFYGFPLPLPHFPWARNDDYRLFRSAVVNKTIQYYGVLRSVTKKVNGSSVTSSYLLYDKYSGEPVLIQSQNEFDDPVYTLNVPAYWMYSQMGMAYKTLGLTLKDFFTDKNGIPDQQFRQYLTAGDELINLETGYRTWVVNSPVGKSADKTLRLIEAGGRLASGQRGTVKVCRSGYRNILSAPATSITSLENPIVGNTLKFLSQDELSSYKVLNASAVLYDEAWGQPTDCNIKSCPPGYQEGPDGRCFAAAEYHNENKIVDGSTNSHYGRDEALFFVANNTGYYRKSGADIWHHRLNDVGVWLENVVDFRDWWVFEKCINFPAKQDIFIGHAADETMKIYIDGNFWFQFDGVETTNSDSWNIRRVTMEPGKHTFRVESSNIGGGRSVGFEIYTASEDVLVGGDVAQIENSLLFSTKTLRSAVDPGLWYYITTNGQTVWSNLTCEIGKALNICDGTPNCGYAEKGSCPDGYTRSPDGQACVQIGAYENTDPALDLIRGDMLNAYSVQGAIFYDENSQETSVRVQDSYWGMANCSNVEANLNSVASKMMQPLMAKANVTAEATADTSTAAADTTRVAMRSFAALASSGQQICGRMNIAGIWLRGAYDKKWVGVNACLKVPETKVYYIGMGADNQCRIYIDDVLTRQSLQRPNFSNDAQPFLDWKLFPVSIPAGNHKLTIEAMNMESSHAVAVEVYNNTQAELINGNANIIFSTKDLLDGKPKDTYVKNASGVIEIRRYTCPLGFDVCAETLGCPPISDESVINPYLQGLLGNWLAYKELAWLTTRSGQDLITKKTGSTGVRKNGYYEKFYAYWIYNPGWRIATNVEWVTSKTVTIYDKSAQELENKDALGRYSGARYGFKSTLPVAVGSNMRQREIFYDGFEDYKFNDLNLSVVPCEPDDFNIRNVLGSGYVDVLDNTESHSGNFSMKLESPVTLTAFVFSNEHVPRIYLGNNSAGEYYRNIDGWMGLRGFNPVKGNKYIFSAWVKDNAASSSAPGITVEFNAKGVTTGITLTKKAVVEGWKLVEGTIDVPALTVGNNLEPVSLTLKGGSGIRVDDIRIFPYDGQLKTFSYDEKTLHVMAELDENNYATFYEYDDEGTLVRLKKETERGIMTIKENRSAYRNTQQ
jgi:hypothetical protein